MSKSKRRALDKSAAPFLIDGDPTSFKEGFKKARPHMRGNRGNTIKYLTKLKPSAIINRVKRKDDKTMAKTKTKNYRQTASILLLSAAAALGITDMLGGELVDAFVGSLLVVLLMFEAMPKQ